MNDDREWACGICMPHRVSVRWFTISRLSNCSKQVSSESPLKIVFEKNMKNTNATDDIFMEAFGPLKCLQLLEREEIP